ncbi:MAG: DUF1015 domain-containing protein [Eubacteriales bacterium]
MNDKKNQIFTSANVLIPNKEIDMSRWSVVACDQYTSEQEYWESVKQHVENENSTLHMVFPEIYLEEEGFETRIENISNSMKKYLADNIFTQYPNSYVYVRRELANKKVRHGIIGKIDLEHYEYTVGAKPVIRATEGTVLERIPPRVKIREKCPLELPHVMLLIDDEADEIIGGIAKQSESLACIYDFELMQESGHISGYLLNDDCETLLNQGIEKLANQHEFDARYGTQGEDVLLFAVGDGNHSLATAKKCYENLKVEIGEKALESEARYALVEVVNLHDSSLEFEAIHRVVFDVNAEHMLEKLSDVFQVQNIELLEDNDFVMITNHTKKGFHIINKISNLAVGNLQRFIDDYIAEYGGSVDYIHGESVVTKLCEEGNTVGFLLNSMEKSDLFKTVIMDGALPRKTFSMGEACDKRFYLEAREIK